NPCVDPSYPLPRRSHTALWGPTTFRNITTGGSIPLSSAAAPPHEADQHEPEQRRRGARSGRPCCAAETRRLGLLDRRGPLDCVAPGVEIKPDVARPLGAGHEVCKRAAANPGPVSHLEATSELGASPAAVAAR